MFKNLVYDRKIIIVRQLQELLAQFYKETITVRQLTFIHTIVQTFNIYEQIGSCGY